MALFKFEFKIIYLIIVRQMNTTRQRTHRTKQS